jgi:hypothetical protein
MTESIPELGMNISLFLTKTSVGKRCTENKVKEFFNNGYFKG